MKNNKRIFSTRILMKSDIRYFSSLNSLPRRQAGHLSFQSGQALITLLFFAIIGITVTSAAIMMVMVNSISGSKFQEGMIAYQIAESGAENGLLRVLRTPPPTYTGETNLQIGSGDADITVTGTGTIGDPFIITSTGQTGNFIRKIEVQATYVNNLLTVTSKREIF